MYKKLIFVIVLTLFLLGCSQKEEVKEEIVKEVADECFDDIECDDGNSTTLDKCKGTPAKCVNSLKDCSEMGGTVCIDNENCTEEMIAADKEHCCIGVCKIIDKCKSIECSDDQVCVKGFCQLKNCSELKGFLCEKKNHCPKEVFRSEDSSNCCPIKCIEANTIYLINEEIDSFIPWDSGIFYPDIDFTDEAKEGYQLTYKKGKEFVEVSVWIFGSSQHLNSDIETYITNFLDGTDKGFMEKIYEDYQVLGIKNTEPDRDSYLWNSGSKVIKISNVENYRFLMAYLEKYDPSFEVNETFFE